LAADAGVLDGWVVRDGGDIGGGGGAAMSDARAERDHRHPEIVMSIELTGTLVQWGVIAFVVVVAVAIAQS
jgi:hypothetical protein